jgi:hypothetical protein
MNKVLLLIMCITLVSLVEAQEAKQFSLGLGIEANMYARRGVALGTAVSADYGFLPNLAAGIKFGFSHNLARIMALEPEVFARWYAGDVKGLFLFVQAGLGTSVIFEDRSEGRKAHPAVMGNLAAGLRIPLKQWYVEPYLRTGYPFIWGAGVSAGRRF